jgi:DNA-binding MarR family transcriptional regulator
MDDAARLPPSLLAITAFLLSKAGRLARQTLGEHLSAHQLHLSHLAVLTALADFGPAAQRQLGARLSIDPSDLVAVMDDLESADWIQRRRDPADRRRYVVSLTKAGWTALEVAARDAAATHDELLAPLDLREREQLHRLLLRVLTHLDPHARAEG